MWVSDQQILKGVRETLARLKAELAETRSAPLVGAIEIALGELAARADGRGASLAASCRSARALVLTGSALNARIGGAPISPSALPEVNAENLAAIAATYATIKQALADCALALNAAIAGDAGDEAWRQEVRAFFLAIAKHDAERATQNAVAPSLAPGETVPSLDVDRLAAYFAKHPGVDALRGPFKLIEAKQLSGGFSRQTLLATVCDAEGRTTSLVIRKQVPGGFLEGACNVLVDEKPFFDLCHRHGLPVPRLFWHETDASVLNGDFFVTECMPGRIVGSSYQMAEGLGEDFFRQLARILATLHTLDWSPFDTELRALSRIPATVPANAEQAALAMVHQFESYWRAANLEPLPTLELLVDWLKRNVPRVERRAVLCHGDIGFHNMLVEKGQTCALLDWETSRLADPARDLSYIYTMVTHYVKWEQFMGWYREAGGPDVDQASLDYYGVFAAFAHVIVCEVAMGDTFPRSEHPDLGYLHLGLPIKAYFFNEVLRDGAPVWMAK